MLFGANIKLSLPYYFKILDLVLHKISLLYSEMLWHVSYGQLHILDFSEANKIRLEKV